MTHSFDPFYNLVLCPHCWSFGSLTYKVSSLLPESPGKVYSFCLDFSLSLLLIKCKFQTFLFRVLVRFGEKSLHVRWPWALTAIDHSLYARPGRGPLLTQRGTPPSTSAPPVRDPPYWCPGISLHITLCGGCVLLTCIWSLPSTRHHTSNVP